MLKKLGFGLAIIALFVIFITPHAKAVDTSDFVINDFNADYYLSRNSTKTSTLDVVESITATFPDFDQNHGILRTIPEEYQGHTISLDNIKVTDETGASIKFTQSSSSHNTVLKIGNADRYVHGKTNYIIKYSMRNVITFQDTDEFYWDINGDQWEQYFEKVTVRLHIPNEIVSELTGQRVCFTGGFGSKASNCSISSPADYEPAGEDKPNLVAGKIITASTTNLSAGQTLTTDIGFKKGTFVLGPEIKAEKRRQQLIVMAIFAPLAVFPLLSLIFAYSSWSKNGRDPKGKGVIVPEYVSPKGLNVLDSSYALEQKIQPKAFSAAILEMAVGGYLQINEKIKDKLIGKSTDYEIQLVKDVSSLAPNQIEIISSLFGSAYKIGDKVNISDQKNKLSSALTKVKNLTSQRMLEKGFYLNDPEKAVNKYSLKPIILFIAGLVTIAFGTLGISLLISALIFFIFSRLMAVRTPEGVAMHDYLQGLKDYINLAEKDRIAYLQSPQGAEKTPIDINNNSQKVKLFEDLLPYAMLFGLEKKWAEQFKDMYKHPPSWYNGNMNNFNTIYLANSLGSFNSASSAAFSAPSSSSSSGFGGGGFSGGGGGGGGGGGW